MYAVLRFAQDYVTGRSRKIDTQISYSTRLNMQVGDGQVLIIGDKQVACSIHSIMLLLIAITFISIPCTYHR